MQATTVISRVLCAIAICAVFAVAEEPNGEKIYRERCASCHDAGVNRAPGREAFSHLSMDNFVRALTSGSMKTQAEGLSITEFQALAKFLAVQAAPPPEPKATNVCPATPLTTNPMDKPHWNGWGVDLAQTRFQPDKQAHLTAEQVSKLKLKWAFGFPGVDRAYAQPAVVGGRVYVGSLSGKVYSLDAATGCTYWEFAAEAPVRSGMSVSPDGRTVFFGDQHASAYALEAETGKLVWKTHIDEHTAAIITGTPALAEGKLYVPMSSYEELIGADPRYECCKFRGSLTALDATTGKVLWRSFTIADEPKPTRKNKVGTQLWAPAGAPIWSSPTVDLKARRIYVTTGDNYADPVTTTSDAFLAFDLDTGKLMWSRQVTEADAYTSDCALPDTMRSNCPQANNHDFDFGSSPILVNLPGGARALIAGQKSGTLHAVDPDHEGKILWQNKIGEGGKLGGIQWGSATDGKRAYVALSDVQTQPVAPETAGAQKTMFGMAFKLDAKAGGGLFALDLQSGKVDWKTPHPGCGDKPGCSPAQSAAVTMIPGVIFSGGLDGHLRAYAADTGKIIWDMDTAQDYTTVNGVKANGGSLDGPGAVIVDGMLYVNSGYAYLGSMPGNVLLAFSVDGK